MSDRDELAVFAPQFWERVDKGDHCWDWHGSLTVYGYGQFQPLRGKTYRAHRVSWILTNGDVPEGLVLDHLCRNRACVNPGHLEPVTPRENVLRGIGPSAINASSTRCSKGHEYDSIGSKGERRCSQCSNAKTSAWSLAARRSIECGAETRDGGACRMKIAAGKKCRNHKTTNPATVLYEPAP